MLRSKLLLLAGISVGIAGVASFTGCGDDSATGGGGSSSTGGGIKPPSPPDGAPKGDGADKKTFGVTKLYLGSTTRAGAATSDAWTEYGYDLDGQITQNDFTNHCKPRGNGNPANIFKDGKEGRDNVFGARLLGLIKSAAMTSDIEKTANDALADGSFTVILDMADLGKAANYNPLDVRLLAGKNGMGTEWELVPELLNPPQSGSADAKVKFPTSYLRDNVWVSGSPGEVKLSLGFGDLTAELTISSAILSMKLSDDHTKVSEGTIAGVLKTDQLLEQIRKIGQSAAPDLFCGENSQIEGILQSLGDFSDIMADGSQNKDATCDGISIGLGFDAGPITIKGVGMPAMGGGEPCQMGTTSSTSSSSASTGTSM